MVDFWIDGFLDYGIDGGTGIAGQLVRYDYRAHSGLVV